MKCIKCGKELYVSAWMMEPSAFNGNAHAAGPAQWAISPCTHEVEGGPFLTMTVAELNSLLTLACWVAIGQSTSAVEDVEASETYLHLSGPNAAAVKAWAEEKDALDELAAN